MLGGRAAERVVFGDLSSGAENDLQQATALAQRMVEHFGMSEGIGPVALSAPSTLLERDAALDERPSALAARRTRRSGNCCGGRRSARQAALEERRERLESGWRTCYSSGRPSREPNYASYRNESFRPKRLWSCAPIGSEGSRVRRFAAVPAPPFPGGWGRVEGSGARRRRRNKGGRGGAVRL